jgi:hypothetical protein
MTFAVRTRSQAANRQSRSESRSPTPKRSRNKEEYEKPEEQIAMAENDSPLAVEKDISPSDDTVEDVPIIQPMDIVLSTEPEIITAPEVTVQDETVEEVIQTSEVIETKANTDIAECEVTLTTPEQDENADDENNKSFSFPSLIDPKDKKSEVTILEEQKRRSPEIIQLDDETSGASSPTLNGQQLPKLSTLETGKESEFINRRRPPFRRPASSRRRKRQPNIAVAKNVTVSPQLQMQSPVLNNAAIMAQQANLFRKPLTPIWNMIRNFPKEISNDYEPFHSAMCQWKMETIDGILIPVILRNSQMLVAHSVAHIKLFSKFPTNVNSIAQYLPPDVTLESLPMTESEAWMMNFINTIVCNYELGMQIFQNGDNLVELHSIELYYLFAKKHYLEDLLRIYDGAVPQEALTECKNIIGAILNLKKKILDDLKVIYSTTSSQ